MGLALVLVRRNLRVFWRDRMTVFFSMLAPLVMFLLFVLFLRKQMAGIIADAAGALPDDAYGLCDAWMFASVATMATLSTSLGMLTAFVEDRVTGRFSDYLVAPLRRWQLALGYVGAVLIVSFVVSLVIFVIGQLWAVLDGRPHLSFLEELWALGGILLACLVFSAFNTLMVTFTASQGSYGGYSIVMGTAMGFLSYCYVPPVGLSNGITSVLGVLPFAQAAAIIRQPSMQPAAEQLLSAVPAGEVRDRALSDLMRDIGANLSVNGHALSTGAMVGILLGLTLILSLASSWRMGRIIH